jgi:protein-disulfide isomerase
LGIPIASYGLAFYLCFFLFAIFGPARLSAAILRGAATALSLAAVLFSLYLFYVSKLLIGTICLICVALYVINILLLVVSYLHGRPTSLLAQALEGGWALLNWPLLAFGLGRWSSSQHKNQACGWLGLTAMGALFALFAPQQLIVANLRVPPLVPHDAAALARDLVERWKNSTPITITENRSPGAKHDFSKGPEDAPITLVEFSDFECPACRRFYGEIKEILSVYGSNVRVVHRNFPIDQTCNVHIPQVAHVNACLGALFTRCAGEQGKFWEAVDYVFTLPSIDAGEPPEKVSADISAGGSALNLDTAAIEECMNADRQRARIIEDIDEAIDLGLAATPAVWINGRAVPQPTKASITPILDHLLAERSASNP